MKKAKILMSVFVSTSILLGGVINANAKVSSYIIKDNDKLYNYDLSELFAGNNFKLLSEFLDKSKEKNIAMINDDEVMKYLDYEVLKNNERSFGKYFDYKTFVTISNGLEKPKFLYDRVEKNNEISNRLNISGENLNIDFSKEQFDKFDDVNVTGKNITISNLDLKGSVYINTNQSGNITLNNVKSSSVNIINAPKEDIDLVNVISDKLVMNSKNGTIVNLKGNSKLKETAIQESSKLNNVLGDFGLVTVDIKNKEVNKVELNGEFKNLVVNNGKDLILGKEAKIKEIKANSNIDIVRDAKAVINNVVKDKKVIVKNSIKTIDKKETTASNNSSNGSKNNSGSNITAEANNSSKNNENKNNESNSGSKNGEIKNNEPKEKPTTNDNNNKPDTNIDKVLNVIDKDKSCIMNIQLVNYAVIVLREGTISDYKFFIDDSEIKPTKVNDEGTILKFEVQNRKNKELRVVKGEKTEKFVLKYKQY